MPDEQSNLNTPRRSGGGGPRRRGRRGGRGRSRSRGPRPPGEQAPEEISPAAETDDAVEAPGDGEETAASAAETETHEPEPDTSGGFREPHAEAPEEFASHPTASEEIHHAEPHHSESAPEPASETTAEAAPQPARPSEPRRDDRRDDRRDPRRDDRREPRYDERRDNRPPPAQRQWNRPADFRPAEDTAIHEAVAHATFIANALKELHDQMDEILELVEVAERQKLADEREIDELRRALRRIQPHHRPQPQQQSHRHPPRREEPRPAPAQEEPPPAD